MVLVGDGDWLAHGIVVACGGVGIVSAPNPPGVNILNERAICVNCLMDTKVIFAREKTRAEIAFRPHSQQEQ